MTKGQNRLENGLSKWTGSISMESFILPLYTCFADTIMNLRRYINCLQQ